MCIQHRKPALFAAVLLVAGSIVGRTEAGTVVTDTFNSTTLQKAMTCDVYLPASYATGSGQNRYPVVYLLHWYSGNKNDWQQTGIQQTVDSVQVIAVAPSDGVTTSWWMDSPNIPGQKMCTFVVNDLKKHIDSLYRTNPEKNQTALCGVSMGGYGALNALRRHPDIYGAAVSICGGVSFLDNDLLFGLPNVLGDRTADSANWVAADVFRNCSTLCGLTFAINDNSSDGLFPMNLHLHDTLASMGIDHPWWTFGLGHNYPLAQDMVTIMRWLRSQLGATAIANRVGRESAETCRAASPDRHAGFAALRTQYNGRVEVMVEPASPGTASRREAFTLKGIRSVR
jgi:S-formylglutathione hydrolase FrmB